jgi:predicted nucleic acid-binding protein
MSKALLDKSTVLDLVLARPRKKRILSLLQNYDQIAITTHTFATLFYILRKFDLDKTQIYSYLNEFVLLQIDVNDCLLSYDLAQNADDVEDCLELFASKRGNYDFVTADKYLAKKYAGDFDVVLVN